MIHRPARSPSGAQSRRPTLAIAVAGLSLFVALDGSAVAGQGLIKARDIASGAVTSKKIRSKAIGVRHLSPGARQALEGARGADGTNGVNGVNGLTGLGGTNGANGAHGTTGLSGTDGAAGADGADGVDGDDGSNGTNGADGNDGVITPLFATAGMVPLPTSTPPTTVVEKTAVPAGKYVVLAKTQLTHSGAGDSIHCELKSGSATVDQVDMKTLPALAAIPVSMQTVTTLTTPGTLSVTCDVSVANGSADYSSIIAVPAN